MFFGYKLHMICDAETEIPVSFYIAPGNRHDSVFFAKLFDDANRGFCIAHGAKYIADSAFDATRIYKELHENEVKAVISAMEGGIEIRGSQGSRIWGKTGN